MSWEIILAKYTNSRVYITSILQIAKKKTTKKYSVEH